MTATDWKHVTLEFTAGSRSVKAADDLSLAEILLANRLPPSLFQAYETRADYDPVPIPVTTLLSDRPASGIVCFTLAMDPLWPESAVDRARELCARAGFEHRVLHDSDMVDLLDMSMSPAKLWEVFRRDHGPDTVHFFGTFFVNLVGRRLCRELSAHNLCVGYNREDLLAELLFCLMNGRRPLRYPVRRMDDVNCLFPLWQIPKHLLDACYPGYSASNYRERVDTTTPQRSAIYFLAHCLDAIGPQISLSLMEGIAALMDGIDGWEKLSPIDGTPLMRTGWSAAETENQVLGLLREYFPDWKKPT